jgi:hypothetical protein
MNRLEESKTANNVVIKKVSGVRSCVRGEATNLSSTRDLFDVNTDVFESELIFWKGISEIDVSVRENIRNEE